MRTSELLQRRGLPPDSPEALFSIIQHLAERSGSWPELAGTIHRLLRYPVWAWADRESVLTASRVELWGRVIAERQRPRR
jgi:hypothetical protein